LVCSCLVFALRVALLPSPAASQRPLPQVRLRGNYFLRNDRPFVPAGVHCVSAKAAMQWPMEWDATSVEADFRKMRDQPQSSIAVRTRSATSAASRPMAAGIAARGSCGSAGRSSSSKRHPPPFKPRRRCPPRCAHPHPHTGGRGAGTGGRISMREARYGPPAPPTSAIREVIARRTCATDVQDARRRTGEVAARGVPGAVCRNVPAASSVLCVRASITTFYTTITS